MNKVYVWLPKANGNIGHASLDIAFMGQDREYVSWWPKADPNHLLRDVLVSKATGIPGDINGYADDVSAEGGQPDTTVELDGLDEERMRKAWRHWKEGNRYSMLFSSCATTVAAVLEAGGANLSFACQVRYEGVTLWGPWDVANYARLVRGEMPTIKARIAAGFTPEPVGTLTKAFIRAFSGNPGTGARRMPAGREF